MDNLVNIRAFLAAARLGSFAAAARSFSVAPSVISKRIGQLEHEFRVTLFHRTTRELRLSEDGARLLPRLAGLLADYDDMRQQSPRDAISGTLRIEAPGSVTALILGPLFCDFLNLYPHVNLDLRLTDRLDNPMARACDLTIGTRPSSYEDVQDHPLMPYPCAAYAGREYLAAHGTPQHPRELNGHACLVSLLHGRTWHFYGDAGDFGVTVTPRLSVNDTIVLREGVRRNLGIAVLPSFLIEDDVASGKVVALMPDFRPPPMWIKAQIVSQKAANPMVGAMLQFLKENLTGDENRTIKR